MGAEAYLLAASLKTMMAQRLVRRICPECKKEVTIQKEVLDRIGILKSKLHLRNFIWAVVAFIAKTLEQGLDCHSGSDYCGR